MILSHPTWLFRRLRHREHSGERKSRPPDPHSPDPDRSLSQVGSRDSCTQLWLPARLRRVEHTRKQRGVLILTARDLTVAPPHDAPVHHLASGPVWVISRLLGRPRSSGLFCHAPPDAPGTPGREMPILIFLTKIPLFTPPPPTASGPFSGPPSQNYGLLTLALAAPDTGTAACVLMGRREVVYERAGPVPSAATCWGVGLRVSEGCVWVDPSSGEVGNGCSWPLGTWGDGQDRGALLPTVLYFLY